MVDGVKARLDIRIQHPPIAQGAEVMDLGDRVVRAPLGPEPVGDRLEVGLEDRFQDQLQCCLNNAVGHGGYPQFPDLPRTAWLGDQALPHRQGK